MKLKVPNIAIIIGEGGSGGAIALASASKVIMLENSIYSVISPEGCATILWRDPKKTLEAAEAMKLTSKELFYEMKGILHNLQLKNLKESPKILFRANHVSNQFPLGGVLPRDKNKLISTLEEWITSTPEGVYPPRPATM